MNQSWWKEAVIYQIYPRSFKDSNGDGIGDLEGITQKLDYLADLGVDMLWLGPIYESPNDDNGYDISNYCRIMPEFGDMNDFDRLLREAHKRSLKIMLDLVVNHTSDEHHWFQESKMSADNPYSDFYYWKPEPPNNWLSFFGGPAWTYDETRGAYYLHLFSKKQPDLNWENPAVRQAIYKVMRFWLDKGIDGFRMDVIPFISKRLDFPDADFSDFTKVVETQYANGPRLHEFLQEMHEKVLRNYDVATVGEAPGVTTKLAPLYVAEDRKELNMIFHFGHMFMDWGPGGRFDVGAWKLSDFKKVFKEWDTALAGKGWNSIFLDNHDFPRMVSRWGNDGPFRLPSAKLLATLILSLRGTPSIYQGSELGMTNVQFSSIKDFRDIEILNAWEELVEKGGDEVSFIQAGNKQGRDNARTPMHWNEKANAGFTSADSAWINLNPNYLDINADRSEADPDSILNYYKALLKLRKKHPGLIYGGIEFLALESEKLFCYFRTYQNEKYWIGLNFSEETIETFPYPSEKTGNRLIGNYPKPSNLSAPLRPWEARIIQLE